MRRMEIVVVVTVCWFVESRCCLSGWREWAAALRWIYELNRMFTSFSMLVWWLFLWKTPIWNKLCIFEKYFILVVIWFCFWVWSTISFILHVCSCATLCSNKSFTQYVLIDFPASLWTELHVDRRRLKPTHSNCRLQKVDFLFLIFLPQRSRARINPCNHVQWHIHTVNEMLETYQAFCPLKINPLIYLHSF